MSFLWWIILGLVIGVGSLKFYSWTKEKEYKLKWYEIVLIVIGLFFIVFNIEVYVGSLAELEPKAASMSLVVMGLPGLIFLGAAVGLITKNMKGNVSSRKINEVEA